MFFAIPRHLYRAAVRVPGARNKDVIPFHQDGTEGLYFAKHSWVRLGHSVCQES